MNLVVFAEGTSGDGNCVLPFKVRAVRRGLSNALSGRFAARSLPEAEAPISAPQRAFPGRSGFALLETGPEM